MVKKPPAIPGDAGGVALIPESRRSPDVGNDNPLQYSYFEISHGQRNLVGYSLQGPKEAWYAAVHGIVKSKSRLSNRTEQACIS